MESGGFGIWEIVYPVVATPLRDHVALDRRIDQHHHQSSTSAVREGCGMNSRKMQKA
jgi:hypothetical protein